MNAVHIAGVAMTPFGRHTGTHAPELAQRAILGALDDAGLELADVQAVYCANVFGGMILGQLVLRDLGLAGIPVYNVENACASGATAVHLARHALLADQYDTVLVFGIEQLTALGGGTIPMQRNDRMTDLYARAGLVLPAVYAMRGTRFLHERDATREDLAQVAVKNRRNGVLNEYAQQRTETSVEEVLASRMIADPLTLLQCCPSQVDGAAAVVLTKRRPTGEHAVRVLGSVVQSGLREAPGDDILDAEITARAARLASRRQAWTRPTSAWSSCTTPSRSPNCCTTKPCSWRRTARRCPCCARARRRSMAACRSIRAAACSRRDIRWAPPASRRWSN